VTTKSKTRQGVESKPKTVKALNSAYQRRMDKRKRPTKMTVKDLIRDDGVPMFVRHWLERFVAEKDRALAHSFVEQSSDTLEQAQLIFDVLESSGKETGESKFSEEAVDYVQEYVYRLAQASDFNLWNLGDAAVAALPVLLECSSGNLIDGDANFMALDSAIHRLTTKQERQQFLRGNRHPATTEDERNVEAAFKLSRVLADPRTPRETRDELELLIREFSMSSRVSVEHPALVRRAFLLMCEAKPQRDRVKKDRQEMKNDRRKLLALLDSIDDMEGGGEQ
jgi:hypothetical protein